MDTQPSKGDQPYQSAGPRIGPRPKPRGPFDSALELVAASLIWRLRNGTAPPLISRALVPGDNPNAVNQIVWGLLLKAEGRLREALAKGRVKGDPGIWVDRKQLERWLIKDLKFDRCVDWLLREMRHHPERAPADKTRDHLHTQAQEAIGGNIGSDTWDKVWSVAHRVAGRNLGEFSRPGRRR